MKKRNDILLIAGLLLAAALVWLLVRPGGEGGWAVVTQDGAETARYPLSADCTVTLGTPDAWNILVISNGTVSVTEANCGDHTCVRTGAVSREGETIVCLPHRLVLSIQGGESSGFDAALH